MVELRRYERTPVDIDLEFSLKGSEARRTGRAKDISLGGMFVETATPAPFSSEIAIHLTLPRRRVPLVIVGVVRWAGTGGMGVQFGLLGARETHAITELASKR